MENIDNTLLDNKGDGLKKLTAPPSGNSKPNRLAQLASSPFGMVGLVVVAILILVTIVFAAMTLRSGKSAISSLSTSRAVQVENQDPVRCGRIVLSGRPQGFAIPKGYTYLVVPVDNSVIATKIVNGNLDVGKIILCRTGEGRPLKAYKTVGDVECVAYVAEGSEIGKSIAFAVFPIGYTLPKEWVGKTLL